MRNQLDYERKNDKAAALAAREAAVEQERTALAELQQVQLRGGERGGVQRFWVAGKGCFLFMCVCWGW